MKPKMVHTLILPNRYGIENKIVFGSDTAYLIIDPSENYSRIGYQTTIDNKQEITFVDPSGGPMLEIGSKIGNKSIQSIELASDVFYEDQKVNYIFKLK